MSGEVEGFQIANKIFNSINKIFKGSIELRL